MSWSYLWSHLYIFGGCCCVLVGWGEWTPFSSYTRWSSTVPGRRSSCMALGLQSNPVVRSNARASTMTIWKVTSRPTWTADGSIKSVMAMAWRTRTWRGLSAATFNAFFLPSVLSPLHGDNDITEKLAVSTLSLKHWQLPVSALMMDSAPMPHSFLLDQYVNPLWSMASSGRATKLIYESISGASGQMGPFQSPSPFVSSQIRTTVIHVILRQAIEKIEKRHKKRTKSSSTLTPLT